MDHLHYSRLFGLSLAAALGLMLALSALAQSAHPKIHSVQDVAGRQLIVRGTGFGLIADICIGIIGALIGTWLLPRLGIHLGRGLVAAIVSATIGAILLLLVLWLVSRRRGRWRWR